MSTGGRIHRPVSTPGTEKVEDEQAYLPCESRSVSSALGRFGRQPIRRKAEPGREAESDEKAAEVSEPGDAAEVEADSVADQVSGEMHGDAEEKDGESIDAKEGSVAEEEGREAGDEKAPKIGAKLEGVGLKIYRAGKDPLRSGTRNALGDDPTTRGMRVGNAQQARVTKPPQHHLFPQNAKDKAWFADRGVNVDDYCVNLPQSDHELVHDVHDWNFQVMSTLKRLEKTKGKHLTVGEMLTAVAPLMAAAKIAGLPFVKYGSPRPDEGKKK